MVTVDFLMKYEYEPDQVSFVVRRAPTMIGGTTAQLRLN